MGVFSDWLLYIKTSCRFFLHIITYSPPLPPDFDHFYAFKLHYNTCVCVLMILLAGKVGCGGDGGSSIVCSKKGICNITWH